jgi:cytochrome c-type biogenesis protein CcmH
MKIGLFLTALAIATSGATGALAQDGSTLSPAELDNQTAEVAAELRCLVCRGQSVLESSSRLAQEMKDLIRERLAAGESPDEVKAYFARSYGDYILLKPEARGVSLLVYILPALALLGGGLLLWRLLGKWTRPAVAGDARSTRAAESGPGDSGLSEEQEAWLQQSIRGE